MALCLKAGEDEHPGRGQGRFGFAQDPPGQQMAIAEGRGPCPQDNVQVAVQLEVLEAVIQDEQVRFEPLPGKAARA